MKVKYIAEPYGHDEFEKEMNRIKQLRKNKCLILAELGKKVQMVMPSRYLSTSPRQKKLPKSYTA